MTQIKTSWYVETDEKGIELKTSETNTETNIKEIVFEILKTLEKMNLKPKSIDIKV
jgi:hypothetical protein